MALDDAAADDQADDDTPEDGAESGDGAETAENDGQEASTFLVRDVVRAGETPGTFIIGHLVIVIDEEISALLPKKSAEEYRRLVEQTRVERGCRNDIVVCQLPGQDPDKYSLADGEHRIKASCETQGFCGVRLIHLTDRAAVERWVRENQLAQRNLCDDARAYYYGREYLENLGHQGERNDLSGQNVRRHTGEEVAAEAQTNERTIRRWADFAKSLDELTAQCGPAIRQKVLAGQVKSAQSVIARIIKLPRGQRRAPVRHVVEHGTMPPAERTAPSFVEKLTRTWEKAEEDDRRQFLQALLADEEFAQMIADLQEQADDD